MCVQTGPGETYEPCYNETITISTPRLELPVRIETVWEKVEVGA